jgi:protease-4
MNRIVPLARAALAALLLALVLPAAAPAGDQAPPLMDYRNESWFLGQSPGVAGGPAAGFFNPAAPALNDLAGSDAWYGRDVDEELSSFGFAMGRELNFAVNTTTWGTAADHWRTYDFQLGLAGGTRALAGGLGYRWTNGETRRTPREQAAVLGLVARPGLRTSFGASAAWSLESGAAQYVLDLGVRPFGRDWLTLFGDWTVEDGDAFFPDGGWSAGLEVRPLRGIHVGGRVRDPRGGGDPMFSLMVGYTFGGTSVGWLPNYDSHGDAERSVYTLRARAPMRGRSGDKPLQLRRPEDYFALNLENKVITYQKYRWFDETRVAWLDLVGLLDRVEADDRIAGLVVNLSGCRGRPSLLWELRGRFEQMRAAGKEVIVHGDRFDPMLYYAATGASRITIDPHGMVGLPGFTLSRSYLKGTLAKLGLGFQEFRYFTYKSAAETYSRDSMSEADRQQRQRIVDVIYAQVMGGAAAGRGLEPGALDAVVDDLALVQPGEAERAGLVDGVARWDQLPRWLQENRRVRLVTRLPEESGRRYWDEQWGEPDVIPVVYAVGACAMDSGIKGRQTSAYLRSLVRNPRVKAVVLRADSPGGDVLPSDLVADAVRQLRAAGKPVIVSQGDVAASGGYWISMDGTEILTTPVTITGSIGVIGGWIWDDGIAGKMGVTSDAVSRGRHADLQSLVNIPLVGGIPRRPMNDDELARTETVIRANYDQFVGAVAAGRGLEPAAVDAMAQGRVWMGGDAVERGLCDRIGTLGDAVAAAREAAGIPAWREVALAEYPPRPLIELPSLLPKVPALFGLGRRLEAWCVRTFGSDPLGPAGLEAADRTGAVGLSDLDLEYLRRIAAGPGRPLAMMPTDLLPADWQAVD